MGLVGTSYWTQVVQMGITEPALWRSDKDVAVLWVVELWCLCTSGKTAVDWIMVNVFPFLGHPDLVWDGVLKYNGS